MSCKCQACNEMYKVDFIVPDELWIKLNKEYRECNLLCGGCIANRIELLNEYSVYHIQIKKIEFKQGQLLMARCEEGHEWDPICFSHLSVDICIDTDGDPWTYFRLPTSDEFIDYIQMLRGK